tara:strand:+ start:73493 stop:73882 length:390 start_codon:yes stop_codon:yes gene_type:complete
MTILRDKLICLLTLLSILSVVFGALWIPAAEASLGIEICTAQGVKTITLPAGLTLDDEKQPHSTDKTTLSHCLICLQNQQYGLALAPQSLTIEPRLLNKLVFYRHEISYLHNASLLLTSAPRAPPTFLF